MIYLIIEKLLSNTRVQDIYLYITVEQILADRVGNSQVLIRIIQFPRNYFSSNFSCFLLSFYLLMEPRFKYKILKTKAIIILVTVYTTVLSLMYIMYTYFLNNINIFTYWQSCRSLTAYKYYFPCFKI